MRKFTLLIASLFITIGAMAQITDASQLSNEKCYQIKSKDAARGVMYAKPGENFLSHCAATHNNYLNKDVVVDMNSENQQFALISYEGKYYLYSVSHKKFAKRYNANEVRNNLAIYYAELVDSPNLAEDFVTVVADGSYFNIKMGGNNKLNFSGGYDYGIFVNYETSDDGNQLVITEAAAFDPAEALAKLNPTLSDEQKQAAKDLVNGIPTGVGYPTAEAREAYCNAVDNAEYMEDVEEIKANMLADANNYQMPVDGQAYYIKAKYDNGTYRYIYDNGTKIQMTATKPADLSGTFVFRKVDNEGNYALVNNDGQYMLFYSSGNYGAAYTQNGLANSFELGENDAVLKFIPGPLVVCTNPNTVDEVTEFMGGFAIQGWMIDKNNGNFTGYHYLMAGDPDFHNGTNEAFYYQGGNRSSIFMLEEAEYANKPVLNAVGASSLLTSELHDKAMATFSAPFATVVPEGVTAYYATAGDGFVTLNAVAATAAIPANTGVILVGEEAGSVTMAPAAGETAATIENNVLAHSAGEAKTIPANSYILSAKDNVAGFYSTDGGELAMNKAYIAGVAAQASVELRFPGTTAVEKVEMRNEKEEIYDLQGRRINEITQPGIYVVGGKKVLVK